MAPERTPPSGEEVARRLSSLYDQAELATGNFNGTRASANSSRRPGRRGGGQGGGGSDPAQEDLMRQWFDGARSRIGPVAPAVLPVDRQPKRSGESARPKEGGRGSKGASSDLPTVYELEQIMRPAAELTAAPVLELTAGPASEPTARPVLELTAGPVAGTMTGSAPAAPGPGTPALAALPAGAAPAAASQKSALHGRKQSARRKLAAAQELMARHAARQSVAIPQQAQAPAIEYRPAAPQTGSFPSIAQTGSFPSAGQTGSFPSVPQAVAFQAASQTDSFPSVAQTGSFPSVAQTGSFPSAAQAPAFQAASQPAPYETGSMPRAYEPAPPVAESKAVILPPGYEAPAPAPEYKSVLLPLEYGKPARPSGYQPAPAPPVSEPAPQPPAYESAPRVGAYPSAPMPPVSEPAPQPSAYESAPRVGAYPSAPMPPANEPAPPPVDDAWRQSLRSAGKQQAWPAAPGTVDTTPGFDIDSLVAPAAPPVVGHDSRAAEAVAFARAQIGRPCVWGASGPGSYDPSGLTQAAWKSAGVVLPRATQDQAQVGPAIALADIQPGDLVFLHANVSHVGLYVGDGMMVHAPSPGARITEESIEYAGPATIHSVVRPA
ncbi:NlpC/P60 family protein [Streptomyces populi]|uniref:C40 family peptidase n=1 Tax=Streptomyces populi TaxID=2058924 RepID=UPI0026970776